MISRLRNKFIAISMISITLVLSIIIIAINLINYVNMRHNIDMRMTMVEENGQMKPEVGMKENRPEINRGLNAEAPFDTRFFAVEMDEQRNVVRTDTNNINAVSEEDAIEYAMLLASKQKSDGYYKNYRYKASTTSSGNTLYVFLDCERELNTFQRFLIVSISISITGLILVFLLVVVLSSRMIKPVVESYQKQKRFITDASHEIKTPLTIIEANTEIIEMESGNSEWTKSTRKQIDRLTSLTEKLVFLSRMDEENKNYLEFVDFDLSEAVLDTIDPYTSLVATKGKNIEKEIATGIRYVGDESAIRQVVSLLIDNAVKYSNENGQIKLALEKSGKHIVFTIYNTVEEIEPGKHEELFDRFYRRDHSRNSKTGGFGIGLSTVFAIVQAHRGKISAKSEDGKSLTIQIVL